jgi:hypothetical protein
MVTGGIAATSGARGTEAGAGPVAGADVAGAQAAVASAKIRRSREDLMLSRK